MPNNNPIQPKLDDIFPILDSDLPIIPERPRIDRSLFNRTEDYGLVSDGHDTAIEALELKNKEFDKHIEARTELFSFIKGIFAAWLFIVLVILILSGLRTLRISDAVMIALLTTTTINMISLMVILAKYYFPGKK